MRKISETVVFFGSGPVAAKSLELLKDSVSIEVVITKPRPPHHMGSVPVIETAEKLSLPIETITDKKSLSRLFENKTFKSSLALLIDFGIIVPQNVISHFEKGIVNSHFSLLPQWRGADPITFAILSGQRVTGVSLMLLVATMDAGPIIAQKMYKIPENITTPELTEELIKLSALLIIETLPKYLEGHLKPHAQEKSGVSFSRRLAKEDGKIDWQKSAEQIEREIRAFINWPQSRTLLGKQEVIITEADVVKITGKPGMALIENKKIFIYAGRNGIEIKHLKPIGRREMGVNEFLAGYKKLLQQ